MAVLSPSTIFAPGRKPPKSEIIQFLDMIQGTGSNPAVVKQTKAALDLVTPASENYGGLVLNDPTASNNGYYYRSSSTWVKGRGLPDSIAEVTMGGTANAQTGTVADGVNPADVLVYFATISVDNTGPMTLSISGETARDVVNAAGNALSAGEWTGAVQFFLNSDGDYQLINDAGAAASAAASASAADADADRAELAASVASAVMTTVIDPQFATKATAESFSPVAAPAFIRTAGYAAAGDGGGALYKQVVSEPSHPGKLSITLDDAVTVVWYEIAETVQTPAMYGGGADTITEMVGAGCTFILLPTGNHTLLANLTVPQGVAVVMAAGAKIVADNNSVTLTINGDFQASPVAKVFEDFGSGKVTFDSGYSNAVPRVVYPAWWGINDGTNSDQVAIMEALKASHTVDLYGLQYVISAEILVPYQTGLVSAPSKRLFSSKGQAAIVGAAANINLLRWSDSHGSCSNIDFSANGFANVTLLAIMPELGGSNTTVVNQNHNTFKSLRFLNGNNGIVLMAGIAIGGTASGCWYNRFEDLFFSSVNRGILFQDTGSLDIITSGANSNIFINVTMNGSLNTGVQIDAGGGNQFFNLAMENITNGTSPTATPTGIIIADAMANSGDNPDNTFYSPHWENVTRHATINESKSKFYNSDMDMSLVTGSGTFFIDHMVRTFTPELYFGGASTGITYASRSGTEVRKGRSVTVTATMVLSNKGSATGAAQIGLLTEAKSGPGEVTGSIIGRNMASLVSGLSVALPNATKVVNILASTSTGEVAASNANFTNTSEITVTMTYEID